MLAAVMLGWFLLLMVLSALAGGSAAPRLDPITINRGVVVTPPSGWTSGTDVWNVGQGGVSYKRAGAVVVFVADAYDGGAEELLQYELDQFEADFATFRTLPVSGTTVAGSLPAVKCLFSGSSANGQVEGEFVAVSHNRTGVVAVALAPFGQLRAVQSDVDEMLEALMIP
jgi:hypothetical protein